jgi:hypothetical protein
LQSRMTKEMENCRQKWKFTTGQQERHELPSKNDKHSLTRHIVRRASFSAMHVLLQTTSLCRPESPSTMGILKWTRMRFAQSPCLLAVDPFLLHRFHPRPLQDPQSFDTTIPSSFVRGKQEIDGASAHAVLKGVLKDFQVWKPPRRAVFWVVIPSVPEVSGEVGAVPAVAESGSSAGSDIRTIDF